MESLTRRLGKTPVEVHDAPGFVSNRVLMPMINEAVFCLAESVGDAKAIMIARLEKVGVAAWEAGWAVVVAVGRPVTIAVGVRNAATADPRRGLVRVVRAVVFAVDRPVAIAVSVRNAAAANPRS